MKKNISESKERLFVFMAAVFYLFLGRDRLYRLAQEDRYHFGKILTPGGDQEPLQYSRYDVRRIYLSIRQRIAQTAQFLFKMNIARLVDNYKILQNNYGRDRITDVSLSYYATDSLGGYGDVDFAFGDGKRPLLEQQRGLIIPLVEEEISKFSKGEISVVEVGTGNGDVIAYLSKKFPDAKFTGIDLSVSNAKRTYDALSNLDFIEGYALDIFQSQSLKGDILFATSTMCVFAPLELKSYIAAARKAGFRSIVISDPVVWGFRHQKVNRVLSRHMDGQMWWHNYFGYLQSCGYNVAFHETVTYMYPTKEVKVILISATLSE